MLRTRAGLRSGSCRSGGLELGPGLGHPGVLLLLLRGGLLVPVGEVGLRNKLQGGCHRRRRSYI